MGQRAPRQISKPPLATGNADKLIDFSLLGERGEVDDLARARVYIQTYDGLFINKIMF